MRPSLLVALGFWSVLGAWLLAGFEENLHCDQVTSFRIAVGDPVPHAEEAIEGGPPLAYRGREGTTIRLASGLVICLLITVPGLAAALAGWGRIRRSTLVRASCAAWVLTASLALLPQHVIGERIEALAMVACTTTALPLVALIVLARPPLPSPSMA